MTPVTLPSPIHALCKSPPFENRHHLWLASNQQNIAKSLLRLLFSDTPCWFDEICIHAEKSTWQRAAVVGEGGQISVCNEQKLSPQSHSSKEIHSANDPNEQGSRFFPGQASRWGCSLVDTLTAVLWDPGQRTKQSCAQILTHGNHEIRTGCCFKLLSIW